MNQPDEVSRQLDVIARLLEAHGFAVEVNYPAATIIVWTDNWPVLVSLKKRSRQPTTT